MSPLMRSKLFVPGSRPELFAKAAASAADALSFDLEDAVAGDRKAEARAAVAGFLRQRGKDDQKLVVVRANGWASGLIEADLDAIVGPGLDMLNLPMVESAEEIRDTAAALARREAAQGLSRPIPILANIETPKGFRLAAAIAAADPRVVGLQIGYADLFEPFGIERRDEAALGHVRVAIRLAAAEAGIAAFDGAFAGVSDPARFEAECLAAQRLGFSGKSCIHPTQIPIANRCFLPGPEAVARAKRVVEAADEAQRKGVGAYLVDGQMVDAPFVVRARAILALVERATSETGSPT